MANYLETIEEIEKRFQSWKMEAIAGAKNQAAALRARKLSMSLRDDMKNFRVASVENDSSIRTAKKESKEG